VIRQDYAIQERNDAPLPDLIAGRASDIGFPMDVLAGNSFEQFRKLKVSPVQRFDNNPAGLFPQIDRIIHL
jgi:hypothetical protein